ncbi:MAG: SRPBCC family protein [Devosia sp.]
MKRTVLVQKTIGAPQQEVWAVVRTGEDIGRWLPAITSCRLDGMSRHCTMTDGSLLEEEIISVDDATHTFAYSVNKHPMPLGPVLNVIHVEKIGDQTCRVDWSAQFDADDATVMQVKPMLEGLFTAGIDGLEALRRM